MSFSSPEPKTQARMIARTGVGLALALIGFTHYLTPEFPAMVGQDLGVLEPFGVIWGFIYPLFLIVGGVLLAFGIYLRVAAILLMVSLGLIPVGLMLKSAISAVPLGDTMSGAVNALIWIIALLHVLPPSCCSVAPAKTVVSAVKPVTVPPAKPATPPTAKAVMDKPAATFKAAPMTTKKVAPKKSAPKKAPGKK